MTNQGNDLGIRTALRFARCPRCQELIDAASVSCRYCGIPVSAEELEQSAGLHERLIQAKSKANNRASMSEAIKTLIVVVLLYTLWFLARFFLAYR